MSTKNVAGRGTTPQPLALSSSSMEMSKRPSKPYYENSRHSWVFTKAPPAPEALTAVPTAFYSPSFDGLPEEKTSSSDTKRCSASNLKEFKLKDDLNRKRAPTPKNASLPVPDSAFNSTTSTTGSNSQRNSVTSSNRDSVSSDMGYFSTSPGSEPGKVAPAILNQLSRSNINPHEVFSRQPESSLMQNLVSPSPRPYSEDATPLSESVLATARSSSYLTPISFSPTASFNELPHGPFSPGSNVKFNTDEQFKKGVEINSQKKTFTFQKTPTNPRKQAKGPDLNVHDDKRDSGLSIGPETMDDDLAPQNDSTNTGPDTQKNKDYHRSNSLPTGSDGLPVPMKSSTFPAPSAQNGTKAKLDPLLQRRMNIALEILQTERTYVSGLELIERVFYRPLVEASKSASPILDTKRISDIFANLMGILTVNREFLSQLELRLEGGAAPWSPEKDLVGDIFCQMAPYFRMYSLYVKNFNSALSVISDQMGKSPAFASFLKGSKITDQCKGLPFESYLILPVQRIPRYKLLIEDLLKRTDPSHLDHSNLVKGLDIVQRVAIFVNETIRQHEMFMEMLKIQNSLTGFNEVLLVPGRRLIKKGSVHKICRKNHQRREFFLFTDLLVYASGGPAPEVPLTFHRKVELEQSKVVDVPDTDYIKNSFQIISPEKSFAVYCSTPEEKERWVSTIRETIEDLLSSKRTLRLSAAVPPRRAAEVVMPQVISNYQAPVWIPDDQAIHCHSCREEFTVFRRKHHCRLCGNVICHACSANTFFIPGSSLADLRPARACDLCYRAKFNGVANSAMASKRSSFLGESAAPSSVASFSRFPFNAPRRLAELRDSFVSRDSYCSDTSTLDGGEESLVSSASSTFTRLQRMRTKTGSAARSCQLCLSEFTVFKWKNQCVSCRKIICGDCLSKKARVGVKRESMVVGMGTISSGASSIAEAQEHLEEEEASFCDPCYLGVDPAHVIVNPNGGGWGVHEAFSLDSTVVPSSNSSALASAAITSVNSSEAIHEKTSLPIYRPSQLANSIT